MPCPPGTRTSLYQNPEYLKVAPFAKLTLASIDSADPNKPSVQPVPYVGVQYAAIPEFQGIGTSVGQQCSAALAGSSTVDAALAALPDRLPPPPAPAWAAVVGLALAAAFVLAIVALGALDRPRRTDAAG